MKKTLSIALGSALFAGLVLIQAPSMSASSSKSKKKDADAATTSTSNKAASTSAPASTPSAADIASARSKGLVWLNVSSKVYHYSSDKVYGTTKSGKFVTEAEARAAGAKLAGGATSPASTPVPAAKTVAQPTPAPAPAATPAAKTTAAKADKTSPPPPPNAGDIAAAKSRGLVWLNVSSNVYHYSGDKTYGTTKNGKFVTEAEAKAAGGKPAAGSAPPASAPVPTPAAKSVAQPVPTPAPVPAATPAAKAMTEKVAKTPPPPPPNAGDIAAAKSRGLVWLNLNTKVYHNPADKEYGTTKNGKFVTEAEAKAAGAKLASK